MIDLRIDYEITEGWREAGIVDACNDYVRRHGDIDELERRIWHALTYCIISDGGTLRAVPDPSHVA